MIEFEQPINVPTIYVSTEVFIPQSYERFIIIFLKKSLISFVYLFLGKLRGLQKERHPSLGKPSINAFTSQETHKIPALAVHLSPRAPRSALCNEFDKKQSYQEETRSAYSTMDEWNLSFPLPPPKRHNVPYHISSQRKIREIQQTDMIHRVAIKARTFEKRVEELTKRRAKTANQAHFLRPLHESIPYFNE